MSGTFRTAAKSVKGFIAIRRELVLRKEHLGDLYFIKGDNFAIFRETEKPSTSGEPVTLVIGFRLKFVKSNPLLHWLFQRVCIITTPFWCGLTGFKTKLWMVAPESKNYLGIYDWRGESEANKYIDFLIPVLKFFSVGNTVWFKKIAKTDLEDYLINHQVSRATEIKGLTKTTV